MPRWGASLLLALVFPLASGCYSAKIGRGDVARDGVQHQKPPLALTAAVAPFENKSGVEPDTVFAVSKSVLTVLSETRLFKNVYTTAEMPHPDVRFEGAIRKVSIYENYWWMGIWLPCAVSMVFVVIPLLGAPYCTQSGHIYLDVRAVDGKTGAVVASYNVEWDDTFVYTIWSSGQSETFFEHPAIAMQAVSSQAVSAVLADYAKYEPIARARAAERPLETPPQAGGTGTEGGRRTAPAPAGDARPEPPPEQPEAPAHSEPPPTTGPPR